MPGPWSSKVSRRPRLRVVDERFERQRAAAAVVERVARQLARRGDDLGLVDQAEARARPPSSRTRWRTRDDVLVASGSAASHASATAIVRLRVGRARWISAMPFSTFERGAHAGQRQAELDQRDRDRRPHADDHRLGVEHARHGGDVGEHAADEGVDDLERRDVDQHAAARGRRRSARSGRPAASSPGGRACRPGCVTSRQSPILRIGMRSIGSPVRRSAAVASSRRSTVRPARCSAIGEGVGERRLGDRRPAGRRRGGRWSARSAGGCR